MVLQSQETLEKERHPVPCVCVLFIPSVSLSVYLHSVLTTVLIQKVSRINQLAPACRDTTLSAFLRQLKAKVECLWANSAGRVTSRTTQKRFSAETSPTQVNKDGALSQKIKLSFNTLRNQSNLEFVEKMNVTNQEVRLQQLEQGRENGGVKKRRNR